MSAAPCWTVADAPAAVPVALGFDGAPCACDACALEALIPTLPDGCWLTRAELAGACVDTSVCAGVQGYARAARAHAAHLVARVRAQPAAAVRRAAHLLACLEIDADGGLAEPECAVLVAAMEAVDDERVAAFLASAARVTAGRARWIAAVARDVVTARIAAGAVDFAPVPRAVVEA